MTPTLSYTIWYSPRTGSNLLCDALLSTGVAGRPEEWLGSHDTFNLFAKFGVRDANALHRAVWEKGTTPNGVFGLRCQTYEPYFENLLSYLAGSPGALDPTANRMAVWEQAFPNHRHIFLTRRNKFRQAVSWYKASQTKEWFREVDEATNPRPVDDRYDADDIGFFLLAAVSSEAAQQELFAEGRVSPLVVVYEDFVRDHDATVRRVLTHLGIGDAATLDIAPPILEPLADELSEEWVQRARTDIQKGFTRRW